MDASTQECPINDGRGVEGLKGLEGYYFIEIHPIYKYFHLKYVVKGGIHTLTVPLLQFNIPLTIKKIIIL